MFWETASGLWSLFLFLVPSCITVFLESSTPKKVNRQWRKSNARSEHSAFFLVVLCLRQTGSSACGTFAKWHMFIASATLVAAIRAPSVGHYCSERDAAQRFQLTAKAFRRSKTKTNWTRGSRGARGTRRRRPDAANDVLTSWRACRR